MPEEEKPAWLGPAAGGVTGVSAAGGAALLAALVGDVGAAMLVAGAAPAVRQAVEDGALWLLGHWRRNVDQMVDEAAAGAQLAPEELIRQLRAAPAGVELFWDAVQGAAHATVEAKIGALGQSLAAGALDAEEVNRELLFVRAMADLEAPHLRILEHLDSAHSPSDPDYLYELHLDQLAELPGIGPAIHPLLGTLERHGVVEALPPNMERLFAEFSRQAATGTGGGFIRPETEGRWKISRFGRECLHRLRAAGLDQSRSLE